MSTRTLLLFGLAVVLSPGCRKDLDEINTNNNSPNNVEPQFLLRKVIYDHGEQMSYEGFVAGNLLGQYFTEIDFNLFDRHNLSSPQVGGNPWPVLYRNLRDNAILLDRSRESAVYAVYEGPALIMRAYLAAELTDIYGDVPYTQALGGASGNVTPTYDTQESIYTGPDGVLESLDQGIAAINAYSGAQTLQGDILYNGDLAGWVRLANSLKIKALMRISDRMDVGPQLQDIVSGGMYITSNSQNAKFAFSSGPPNSFRMATLRDGDFNLFVLSETMQEILEGYSDPRISTFFRPFGNDTTGTLYAGLLNGPDASSTSISVANYSRAGTIFRENTGVLEANFITAWETHLFLAEAAERGLIGASAQMEYEMGVTLAFDYWNTTLPADYLTTGSAAYGAVGADRIEQIVTQKWIANIINGYEGWIEYRRTGFPQLKTVAASLNNDLIPVRMPYPTEESALNGVNYSSATGGVNDINLRTWWDVD